MPKYRVNKGCNWAGHPEGSIIDVPEFEALGWIPRVLVPVSANGDTGTVSASGDIPGSRNRKAPAARRRRKPEEVAADE